MNEVTIEDAALIRPTLRHRNQLRVGMTDAEVITEYQKLRADDEATAAQRKRESAERLERAAVESMQRALRNAGEDPAGMSVEAMRARIEELHAMENEARQKKVTADKIDREAREKQKRERLESIERVRLFQESGCPELHALHLTEIDRQNKRWIQIRDLLASRSKLSAGFIVALLGPRGTGKTQLAASVIREASQALLSARYVRAMDLFRDLRSAFDPKPRRNFTEADTEESHVGKWSDCELLVIDELHNRGGSNYELNALTNLLDRRYGAKARRKPARRFF